MESLPSNSHKSNSEPKKVKSVTTNKTLKRKKSLGRRVAETFGGEDAQGVWNYVTLDVLLPALKDMVADAVSQGVERMIFGEARSSGRRSGRAPVSGLGYTNYGKISSNITSIRRDEPRTMSRRGRSLHDFGEIVIASRPEAENVIVELLNLSEQYPQVTVADLYDLVNVEKNHVDRTWGWTSLESIDLGLQRVREGYLLLIPKPEPLER